MLTIILNFSLDESFSQTYIKIDGKVIPLLIPPFKMIKGLRAYPKIIFLYTIMQQDNCTNPR